MKNFSSPIEGIVEEININLIQNPISLIQSNESDAWFIKFRVDPNYIENYLSLLRTLDYNN